MSSNIFQNETLIAKKFLSEFENNLVFSKTINRQFEDTYSNNTGTIINIRKPTRFFPTTGRDITSNIQTIKQRTVPLTIRYQDNVAMELTSQQMALNMDDLTREVISPAALQLANKVDMRAYDTSLGIYNAVGTAGTAPNSFGVINNARTLLTSQGVLLKPRYFLFNVLDGGAVSAGLQGQYNYQEFNKEILDEGVIGRMAGFDMYQVQNTVTSVRSSIPDGTTIGTPVVATTSVSGDSSIAMSGFTVSTTAILKKGAIFTVSGVGAVNPITRVRTGLIQQFVVTADVDSDSSGDAVVPIAPTIIFDSTDPYTNVTALPTSGATVTVNGSHTVNIAYHPEAFTLAMIKLGEYNDSGAYMKTMVDKKSNVSIRMVRQYNVLTDVLVYRFDVLYGVECFPEYACRGMGSYNGNF